MGFEVTTGVGSTGVVGLVRNGPGLKVMLHGRGGHGSRPEACVDPVVMAAATVMRVQAIVSREIPAGETAVVTIGTTAAGASCVYWLLGGADPAGFGGATTIDEIAARSRDLPSNHSPRFAPVIEPTQSTGIGALAAAARTWLQQ